MPLKHHNAATGRTAGSAPNAHDGGISLSCTVHARPVLLPGRSKVCQPAMSMARCLCELPAPRAVLLAGRSSRDRR